MRLAVTAEAVHKVFMTAEPSLKLASRCQRIEQKQGIEAAAELLGLTTSKFLLMHALEAAAAVLRKHGRSVPFLDAPIEEGQNEQPKPGKDPGK